MRLSVYSKYQVKNKLTCNQRLQNLCRKWLIMSGHPRVSSYEELVPAPMREDTTEIVQPLDRAVNTIKSDAIEVVPAPRLELGTP